MAITHTMTNTMILNLAKLANVSEGSSLCPCRETEDHHTKATKFTKVSKAFDR